MKRKKLRWRTGWILLAAAVASLGALGIVDLRQPKEAASTVLTTTVGEGRLLAGAGKAEVDLPADLHLAGYRPFGRIAEGGETKTFVRTLLLEVGEVQTGIVLLELMTLSPNLAERIATTLQGRGLGCSLVAVTHTHSGPGGYDKSLLPQAAAIGRFDQRIEDALVDAVQRSFVAARAALAPATLAAGEETVELATNRDRKGAAVDDRLTKLVLSREDGAPLATVLRATAHPTLSAREVGPHGDWPAEAMAALEREGGVAFVLQGAVGDARAEGESPRLFGEEVAARARAVPLGEGTEAIALGCSVAQLDLPPPDLSGMVPSGVGRLVSNVAIPFAPAQASMVGLRLAEWTLLGVPAEPTWATGRCLEAVGGGEAVRVVSLAQGYAGYVVEEADMEERVFSSRQSWFGGTLGPRLLLGAATIAAEFDLGSRQAAKPEVSCRNRKIAPNRSEG